MSHGGLNILVASLISRLNSPLIVSTILDRVPFIQAMRCRRSWIGLWGTGIMEVPKVAH